jgi:hypothetical protein
VVQSIYDEGGFRGDGGGPAPAASDRAALIAEARRRGLDVE